MLFFSAASLWENTIKSSLGRADFVVDARLLRRGLLVTVAMPGEAQASAAPVAPIR